MDALAAYLRETRTTPRTFAKLIGIDADRLARMLSGIEAVETPLAQRMIDATGGALNLDDLIRQAPGAGAVVDMRSRFAAEAPEIDVQRLTGVLAVLLPGLVGGARRAGDEHLPRLAADAAANTYAALSTVTTRRGPDRLIQALRPVFAEILSELSAPAASRRRLQQVSEEAAALYFQAPPQKRPA